jgi:hypothetical protein
MHDVADGMMDAAPGKFKVGTSAAEAATYKDS